MKIKVDSRVIRKIEKLKSYQIFQTYDERLGRWVHYFILRFQAPRDYNEDFTASLKAQITQLNFVTIHGRAIWFIVKIDNK